MMGSLVMADGLKYCQSDRDAVTLALRRGHALKKKCWLALNYCALSFIRLAVTFRREIDQSQT